MKHNRYRNLRKSIKLTQQEVAKILNIAQTAVSKWELGQTIPDQAILPKIAELYNTTVDYLLTGKEPSILAPQEQKSEIEEIYEMLTPGERQLLKSYALGLLSSRNDKKINEFIKAKIG